MSKALVLNNNCPWDGVLENGVTDFTSRLALLL